MNNQPTEQVTQSEHLTYEEWQSEHIAGAHEAEAQERGIPLRMLTGFPALSDEPDEDDPIEWL